MRIDAGGGKNDDPGVASKLTPLRPTARVWLSAIVVAVALTGIGAGSAPAFTRQDLINRLTKLDKELAGLKKDTPEPGTFALGHELRGIADHKEDIVKDLFGGLTAYGVKQSDVFIAFDCADRSIRRAGYMDANNNKDEAVAAEIRQAAQCLNKVRGLLAAAGQMPTEMRDRLSRLENGIDDLAKAVDKGKVKKGELREELKKAAHRKIGFFSDWFRAGQADAAAAPTSYGVLFADVFTFLDGVDVALVDAEFADKAKGIDKDLEKAIKRKEALLTKLQEGYFATRARGAEATRVCIYIRGPAGQTGKVTLSGSSIGSTNPASFTLNGGNEMVSFVVLGTGDYAFSIERQRDGKLKPAESSAVNVPGGGPSSATAPPAGEGFGTQPCPAP